MPLISATFSAASTPVKLRSHRAIARLASPVLRLCRSPAAARGTAARQSPRLLSLRAATTPDLEAEADDDVADVGFCEPAFVSVDNTSLPDFTQITVEVSDYPGLLRIIAWALGGLGIRVHSACLKTLEDGSVLDVFWLTDVTGRKLSNKTAAMVCERMEELVVNCNYGAKAAAPEIQEFSKGNIEVSNLEHDKLTIVTIKGEPPGHPGFLLEVASLVTAFGATIHEGQITSSSESITCGPIADASHDYSTGRLFRFWMSDVAGAKLDAGRCSALVFVLDLLLSQGALPLQPPSMATYGKR